jgi:hypothetical protein
MTEIAKPLRIEPAFDEPEHVRDMTGPLADTSWILLLQRIYAGENRIEVPHGITVDGT